MSDSLKILRSAQVNFDNLLLHNPAIAEHPMYRVARLQLNAAVNILTGNVCDHGEPEEFECEKCAHDQDQDGISDRERL